ncbi:hypothetical protein IW143_000531 [Coemansia sp. RSA 520]|nr:hypothetical protein IW143_000531 [Coemansia sp. RSA 520]
MADLPTVIIERIIYFATVYANKSLGDWKNALRLLWINREWRHAAKRILYSCAIVDLNCKFIEEGKTVDTYFTDNKAVLMANTNVLLIEQNDSGAMAKQFVIKYREDGLRKLLLLCIITALAINESDCPAVSAIKEGSDAAKNGQALTDDQRSSCLKAATDVAQLLVNRLPNITDLDICTHCKEVYFCQFVNTLISSYNGKLTGFHTNLPVNRTTMLVSETLKNVTIRSHVDTIIHMPTINPQPLEYLMLNVRRTQFRWDMFRYNNNSNVIRFDNLRSLKLFFVEANFGSTQVLGPNDHIPQLVFPKLTTLILYYLPLTTNEVQYLMKAPLRILNYSGCLDTAHMICNQSIGNLADLTININLYNVHIPPNNMIAKMNKMFSKTAGIAKVTLTLTWQSNIMDFTDVYWPHLTHLYLNGPFDLYALFLAIPRMPNLVDLLARSTLSYTSDRVLLVLHTLKRDNAGPVSSKLKHIKFLKVKGTKQLVKAFDELTWYLPELESVDFS